MENQLYIALRNNKLFSDIDLEDLDLSNIQGNLRPLKEGEILYREEEPADKIYLVVSGEINLLKKKLLGSTKSFIFGENDFFGYDEIAEDTARTSTAVALRDCYLIAFSTEELEKILEQNHIIKTNLLNYSDIDPTSEQEQTGYEEISEEDTAENSLPEIPEKDKKADVTSFEQSLKDDLIDKHDTFIEEDSSSYEEELKEETYQKVHSEELPEDQVDENLEETTQMPEEPLFPEDDDEEVESAFEEKETEEVGSDEESLNEETMGEIEAQDNEKSESVESENTEQQKLSDFDNAFFSAFSNEAEEKETERYDSDDKENNDKHEAIFIEESSSEEDDIEIVEEEPTDKNSFERKIEEEPEEENIEESEIDSTENELELEEDDVEIVEEEPTDENSFERKIEEEPEEENIEESKADSPVDELEEKNDSDEVVQEATGRFESAKLQSDQLKKIIKALQLVNSNIRIDEVLNNIVTVATDLTNADRGTLYLIDRENNELWSKVAMGNETKEIRLKIGEGIAGWVAQNRELVNIEDVASDDRFKADFDKSSGYETKSMLCFPIKDREDQIVGVLQLLNSKNGKFGDHDEELLSAISIQCAIALQNAEMLEKLLQGERVSSLGKMTNFLIQDIKKPVLVSKRYAEHLKTKELNKDAAQIVEMILDQLTQVADLVQTTSSYAEGKAVLRASRVSLNEIIKEFSDRLESYVKSRGSQIELNLGEDVKVQLDSKEFFQCYNHLIRNACDAMPDGGKLSVSTKPEKDKVNLVIEDDGIGISESLIDKIFDPFMTHGKKEGTGLGLTITKKIVESHSGSISVESMLGAGTKFVITLPKASAL